MENKSFIRETFDFLILRNGWWFAPVIILLLFVSILFIAAHVSPVAPQFIYALF